MNDLSKLFFIEKGGGPQDDLPYLTKEARNIECFTKIITRDRGKQGYVNNINKFIKNKATKEIAFIYFYVNDEFFANYQGDERINAIKKRLAIDWELDDLIWTAISELEVDDKSLETKMLENYYSTLNGYNDLLGIISAKITANIILLQKPKKELTTAEVNEIADLIEKSRADFKWVLDATNQLKVTFKNIEDLKIAKASKGRKVRGTDRLQTDKSIYRRKEDIDV